jgi:hypothetical protein
MANKEKVTIWRSGRPPKVKVLIFFSFWVRTQIVTSLSLAIWVGELAMWRGHMAIEPPEPARVGCGHNLSPGPDITVGG